MSGFELPDRFWRKVARAGPGDCWNWTGSKNGWGYGTFSWRGQSRRAHRLLMESRAPIPAGMVVRHTCDNALCVNPAHLILGTHADNVRDRDERARGIWPGRKGEANATAKLTESTVREIREAHAALPRFPSGRVKPGMLQSLAKRFGVPYGTMKNITDGRQWTHV